MASESTLDFIYLFIYLFIFFWGGVIPFTWQCIANSEYSKNCEFLINSRCATLVSLIDRARETIVVLGFSRFQDEYFLTATIIYHNLQKVPFTQTDVYKYLIWVLKTGAQNQ